MNGLSKHPSSFRQGLPERERGDAAGVFRPKSARANGAWFRRGLSHRAVKAAGAGPRKGHAFQHNRVANGALRPSPHLPSPMSGQDTMPP
jgi:hypothetical protein